MPSYYYSSASSAKAATRYILSLTPALRNTPSHASQMNRIYRTGLRQISSSSPSCRRPITSNLRLQVSRRQASTEAVAAGPFSASSIPPPPPSRASLPIRFIRTLGLAIVFIPLGFAMATVPIAPAINELISPPSDAATVKLFEPYDDRSAVINETVMQHPIAQSLRADPRFTESRPFMKLPPSVQQHHLTSGALGGAGKLWVPPLTFAEAEGKSIVIILYLGSDMCGHPGIVHGGLLATLLDEGLAKCCFQALPHKVGMTASLTIDYKRPTPADTFVVLRGETTRVEGRKAWVEGRIEELNPADGKDAAVFATAKGLFVEPKQAATMAMLYPAASG